MVTDDGVGLPEKGRDSQGMGLPYHGVSRQHDGCECRRRLKRLSESGTRVTAGLPSQPAKARAKINAAKN